MKQESETVESNRLDTRIPRRQITGFSEGKVQREDKIEGGKETQKRPCKKWASYGGRCIEKILAPKSKYIDTSKPGSTKMSRS